MSMTLGDVNILVIDDVNTMRVLTKSVLIQSGFKEITMVSSAPTAMEVMETKDFQLLLCDWHMQPTSGLDFLKAIRAHEKFKNTLFIMVTAETTAENVKEAIKSGVDDYLVKPFSLEQAQTKIYNLLVKKKVLS